MTTEEGLGSTLGIWLPTAVENAGEFHPRTETPLQYAGRLLHSLHHEITTMYAVIAGSEATEEEMMTAKEGEDNQVTFTRAALLAVREKVKEEGEEV